MLLRSCSTVLLISTSLVAQTLIYDSGPLVTHPGMGPGGQDASALQVAASSPFGMNILGYGAQAFSSTGSVINNSTCDDFVVNGLMIIDEIELFCYQTTATGPSINGAYVEIFKTDPSAGAGTPITTSPGFANNLFTTAGYTVTNTVTTTWRETTTTITGTLYASRNIQSVRIVLATPIVLDPSVELTDRFWIQANFTGTFTSGPWMAPITVSGAQHTGEAWRTIGGTWSALQDAGAGTPTIPGPYRTGMPFKLYGTSAGPLGAIANIGGDSNSPLQFDVRGAPHLGGTVYGELTNTNPLAIPLIILGGTDPNTPVPCGANVGTLHASLDNIIVAPNYLWEVPIPSPTAGLGLLFYMQGAEIDFFNVAGLTCDIGIGILFETTDGFSVQFN